METTHAAAPAPPRATALAIRPLSPALGAEIMVHFTVDAKQAVTEHVLELAEDIDEAAVQNLEERPGETTMIGRFGARSRVSEGDTIDVVRFAVPGYYLTNKIALVSDGGGTIPTIDNPTNTTPAATINILLGIVTMVAGIAVLRVKRVPEMS